MAQEFNLPPVPTKFENDTELNDYLRQLVRAIQEESALQPQNRTTFQLGTFTERYDLSTTLTTAQLQEVVLTLINILKDVGYLNAKRST